RRGPCGDRRARRLRQRAAAAAPAGGDPRPRRPAAGRPSRVLRTDDRRRGGEAIKTARVEAARAVSTFSFSAAVARTLTGELVPLDASEVGEDKLGFVLRVPVGVVAGISPFNFPLNLVAHKIAPAIAAGCPMVLKPASQTPFSAITLAELLLDECGLPGPWLSVVTGGGGDVGNALVDHDDVALITFTGSPP